MLNETAREILQQLRDLDLSRPDAFARTMTLETAFKSTVGRNISPLDYDELSGSKPPVSYAQLMATMRKTQSIQCPHCGAELSITAKEN